jgi:hypothetical protein
MKDLKIIRYLPFAFMAHNIEEAVAIGNTKNLIFNAHINTTQFVIATSLFTILGFALVFGKKKYRSQRSYEYAITGFSGMLFLNAFFPHILSAVYFGTYTPGVITAVALILPLTTIILRKAYQSKEFSNNRFFITILSGGIAGLILVAVFLGIGYIFN